MNARALHPQRAQAPADLLDHVARPAHEVLGDLTRAKQRGRELPHALAVDAAVVERRLLRLAAHHEVQRQLVEIAVLEREQLLEAHRSRAAAVAIEQYE